MLQLVCPLAFFTSAWIQKLAENEPKIGFYHQDCERKYGTKYSFTLKGVFTPPIFVLTIRHSIFHDFTLHWSIKPQENTTHHGLYSIFKTTRLHVFLTTHLDSLSWNQRNHSWIKIKIEISKHINVDKGLSYM